MIDEPRTARRSHILPAAFTAVSLFASAACGGNAATPAAASVAADVWAVVDGREIKQDEVEKIFRGTVQQTATRSRKKSSA